MWNGNHCKKIEILFHGLLRVFTLQISLYIVVYLEVGNNITAIKELATILGDPKFYEQKSSKNELSQFSQPKLSGYIF